MTIEYKVEHLSECLDEIKPLLTTHYEEVAMYQNNIDLNPNYDKYLELEKADMLSVITVRDDGTLVGYFISFLLPHIHYQDHIFAVNDILFIDKDYRRAEVGLGMFQFAEEVLKDLGVSVMSIHMKTAIPFDSLCEGLSYDYAERSYTKYIGV